MCSVAVHGFLDFWIRSLKSSNQSLNDSGALGCGAGLRSPSLGLIPERSSALALTSLLPQALNVVLLGIERFARLGYSLLNERETPRATDGMDASYRLGSAWEEHGIRF
jgi:hypothetical protein